MEAALAKAPNNSLLGSSEYRIPFPFGLWVYNGFAKYKKGFGKWIFNRFAATPVLISSVNPDIRQKVATNILHDYGYFNGTVSYQTFVNPKDSLKAKLQYTVDMRNPYFIDTVYYRGFNSTTMQIINLGRRRSLISPGEQFNVTDLDGERTRISGLLRNMGYYYFRPDYLTYQADTTLVPGGHVSLRMIPVPGMPKDAERPFFVGKTNFYLHGPQGQMPNDSLYYKTFWIHYYDKLKIRPNMLHRWLNYQGYQRKRQELDKGGMRRRPEKLYSQYRQTRIQERLASVGIFRYLEMQYTPRDTALVSDTLDVNIRAMLDKPYDAELDFNVTMKSNNQTGPGAAFTVTKNNVFGGGETWNVKVNGSYEWQTGKNSSSLMNSYELGLSSALTFPRIVFPRMGTKEYDFPASTTFRVYIDQMNRAKYYKLLAFGGNVIAPRTRNAPVETTAPTESGTAIPEAYQPVIAKYVTALTEHWGGEACSNADISILVSYVTSPSELGYALLDLDNDGTDELIIANDAERQVIYDLYSLVDGKLVVNPNEEQAKVSDTI